jgi:hypothetical protein
MDPVHRNIVSRACSNWLTCKSANVFIGQHIYDVMGCEWNMPANYDAGVFESCEGDSGEVNVY